MLPRPRFELLLGMLVIAGAASAQTICGVWNHSPTPDLNPLFSHFLGVAAISADDVWAVGEYDSLAGTYTPMLRGVTAHWDGSSWRSVPAPSVGVSGTTLTGVAGAASNEVWAIGYSNSYGTPQTLVLRWDGLRWSVVPSPVITGGSSLASITRFSNDDLWAVGNRNGGLPEFAATVVTLTVHWNGSNWVAISSPNVANRWNDLASVSGAAPNDVWAVGSSRNTAGLYQNLAMHWNGTNWTIVPTPGVPGAENQLVAVAAVATNDVWALGGRNDGVTQATVFLHWNGSTWTEVPGPAGGAALVALASDDIWAVGSTVAHWDGSSWTLAPNPVVSGASSLAILGASKVGACDVWGAGSYSEPAAQHTLAVHLTSGGGSINEPPVVVVSATPENGLAPLRVQLSSAGTHDPDGSIQSYRWDFGDSSDPTNVQDPNPVHTYLQSGPLTYHAVLRVTDNHGATAMSSVAIHIDDPVHVQSQVVARIAQNAKWLAEDRVSIQDANHQPVASATVTASYTGPTSGLLAGVTNAAGVATLRTAAAATAPSTWCFSVTGVVSPGTGYVPASDLVTNSCEPPGTLDTPGGTRTLELSAGPSPFGEVAAIRVRLPDAATVSVQVHDAAGRLVRDLLDGPLPGGDHELRWDGRDTRGLASPSGLYLVRLSVGGEQRSARLLRLR